MEILKVGEWSRLGVGYHSLIVSQEFQDSLLVQEQDADDERDPFIGMHAYLTSRVGNESMIYPNSIQDFRSGNSFSNLSIRRLYFSNAASYSPRYFLAKPSREVQLLIDEDALLRVQMRTALYDAICIDIPYSWAYTVLGGLRRSGT